MAPIADPARADHMQRRLARTLEDRGAEPTTVEIATRLHAAATRPRTAAFDDDHDPRFLHPGRSALVAILDHGTVDATTLALALVHDGSDPSLAPTDDAIRSALAHEPAPGSAARPGTDAEFVDRLLALRTTLPRSGDPHLMEELLALDPGPLAAVLCERLDHLRHLHLGPADAETRRCWREARDVWAPVSRRAGGTLERRFDWWVRKFEPRWSDPA